MAGADGSGARLVRFGTFELALDTWELSNKGAKIKIENQPLRVLALLLERPGVLVTREDLRQRLWPEDTFVDFDHSINAAVKRLREVLHDSAATPRFIETLPKRGYRFIYPVTAAAVPVLPAVPAPKRRLIFFGGLAVAALLAVLFASDMRGMRSRLLQPGPRLPVTSVAVLPLRNLTGDRQLEWLADGMTDTLTTELAQVKHLDVPSVTSAMTYKSAANKHSREIATELKVTSCVEWSLQGSEGRFLVNVQLVDAVTDRHFWAWEYEVDLASLHTLTHRVARDLVREMRVALNEDQQRSFDATRIVNPEAYRAYLLARQAGSTEGGRAEAERWLSKAIEIDPAYAQPYAQLALLSAHGGNYLIGGARQERDRARQMARKALELDDSLAEAHAALGWVEMSDWDWWSAEEHFRRAIDLNSNLLVARVWYAEYLQAMGRPTEALSQAEKAISLDPRQPSSVAHATQIYMHAGRVDEAIRIYRRLLEEWPDYWFAHQGLGEAYTLKGLHRQAIPELQTALAKRGGDDVNINGLIARAYVGAGEPEKARQIAAEFEARAKAQTKPISAYGPSMAYLALGDWEAALRWLEQSYAKHGAMMMMLNRAAFDPLRSDPRFQDLVHRIGLPNGKAGAETNGRPMEE